MQRPPDQPPPRRGTTRPGELPPPPSITVQRIEHDYDDEFPGARAPERHEATAFGNGCTVWLVGLLGLVTVLALVSTNLGSILPAVGLFVGQLTPAEPVATTATGPAPTANVITVVVTPTPIVIDRGVLLRRTQNLNRLITVTNTYDDRLERAVTSSDPNTQQLVNTIDSMIKGFGLDVQELTRDSITMVIYADVEAGVDLSKLQEDDFLIDPDGKGIRINLPPSEVFNVAINNKLSYVEQRTTKLLARPQKELESEVRLLAEELTLRKACELGIMYVAADNAETNVRRLFEFAGFERVDVNAPAGDCVAPNR